MAINLGKNLDGNFRIVTPGADLCLDLGSGVDGSGVDEELELG